MKQEIEQLLHAALARLKGGPLSPDITLDSLGVEREIPVADWIDVGVFGAPEKGNKLGKPLFLEKRRVTAAHTTFDFVVDAEPKKSGIDPYNKLIDRDPKDNVKDVEKKS